MSNFGQLTFKPVYVNNTSAASPFTIKIAQFWLHFIIKIDNFLKKTIKVSVKLGSIWYQILFWVAHLMESYSTHNAMNLSQIT
jgi:hypothetical protein